MLFVGFHSARHAGSGNSDSLDATGKPAPDFTLDSLDAKKIQLSSYKGQTVFLNLCATWPGPCTIEMTWSVDLQSEYAAAALQTFGVGMGYDTKGEIAN